MKIAFVRGPEAHRMPAEGALIEALKKLGEYADIPVKGDIDPAELAAIIREHDVLLTMWGNIAIPAELAADNGRLKYICNITGSLKAWIPPEIIASDKIVVTNWGDLPANCVAEGAFALLLAMLKSLPAYVRRVQRGGWEPNEDQARKLGSLNGLRLGMYGMGVIGRRFIEMCQPFRPKIYIYDPYVKELPEGCIRVDSLEALFTVSQALSVHAGLSDETYRSITAPLLAKLPDNAVIVNTARGGIFDQDALFAELESGRLRAGLDVLDEERNDRLPTEHPARQWENCLFTAHSVSNDSWGREADTYHGAMHERALENVTRFANGEPVKYIMEMDRYLKST